MSGPFVIPAYCLLHILALVVSAEGCMLNSGISPLVNTYIKLGPEFHCCFRLSTDNRPDLGLMDTDNPIRDTVNLMVIHVLLLPV